jgi:hypothetical protein
MSSLLFTTGKQSLSSSAATEFMTLPSFIVESNTCVLPGMFHRQESASKIWHVQGAVRGLPRKLCQIGRLES